MSPPEELYLQPDVCAEPLFARWYTWVHLLAPATASLNVVARHLRIMESYVAAPSVHEAAVRDPALIGGPFANLPSGSAAAVQELIEQTRTRCGRLIELASALQTTARRLDEECVGASLEPLYETLPAALAGLVELVYDLSHHASLRLIEPLLYTEYADVSLETITLSRAPAETRAFALSTPRLARPGDLDLDVPFADPRLDALFAARTKPVAPGQLESLFETAPNAFASVLGPGRPALAPDRNMTGPGLRVRYFGHACLLLQTEDVSILVDPLFCVAPGGVPHRFSLYDLPDRIDYVLITHAHQDHVHVESLLEIRARVGEVLVGRNRMGDLADPSLALMFRHLGFRRVRALDELEALSIPGGRIVPLPFLGEHADLAVQSKLAHLVELGGRRLMLAADSNNICPALYERLARQLGPVDVLFVGMECDGAPLSWLYGPYLTKPLKRPLDRSRTLSGSNSEKALAIVRQLECAQAYVYAMGREPWLGYIMGLAYSDESIQLREARRFVDLCTQRGVQAELLFGTREWLFS